MCVLMLQTVTYPFNRRQERCSAPFPPFILFLLLKHSLYLNPKFQRRVLFTMFLYKSLEWLSHEINVLPSGSQL